MAPASFGIGSLGRLTTTRITCVDNSGEPDTPKGVLLILSLLALLFVDQTALSEQWKSVVRWAVPSSAILVPAAFFLSVVKPDVAHPNRLVNLAYVGGILASVGTVVLGIGLLSV